MPAIVRIKRRIDEESVSAFVLHGKKRRLEDGTPAPMQSGSAPPGIGIVDNEDEVTTVLKLAGTVQDQDDSAISQYARLSKEEARELIEQKSRGRPSSSAPTHTERARAEMRKSLHESRFRVVNCLRGTLESSATEGGANEELTIVDIEKMDATHTDKKAAASAASSSAQNDSLAEMPSTSSAAAAAASAANAVGAPSEEFADSDTGYVYDFYLPANEYFVEAGDLLDDNYLSHEIRACDFDSFFNDNNNDDDSIEYDSEDSNHENQPGNDYPDEDDDYDDDMRDGNASDESEGTRQIRLAVENFVFDDGDEDDDVDAQSSDDEDVNPYQDPYVHSIDLGDAADDVDLDMCDVNRYGLAYARYKKRVLKRLDPNGDDDDDDDDDALAYGCDDDIEDDSDRRTGSSSSGRYHSASENESDAGSA